MYTGKIMEITLLQEFKSKMMKLYLYQIQKLLSNRVLISAGLPTQWGSMSLINCNTAGCFSKKRNASS